MKHRLLSVAAMSGFIAVALGAFAAHGLKKVTSPELISIFNLAVEYQFYHTFALMGLANRLAKQLGFKSPTEEMMKGDYEHLLEVFDKNFGDFVRLER